MSYATASTPTQIKSSGISRLQDELLEVSKRITEAAISVCAIGDGLYGPRPSDAAESPPSANTVDSRLGDIRRALTFLESNVQRLHQS